MNREDWNPKEHSVICINHFGEKYIKVRKKYKLRWEFHPVTTIHRYLIDKPSILKTSVVPRRYPLKQILQKDELAEFQEKDSVVDLNLFSADHAPENVHYNLVFNEKTGIPCVNECIMIANFYV